MFAHYLKAWCELRMKLWVRAGDFPRGWNRRGGSNPRQRKVSIQQDKPTFPGVPFGVGGLLALDTHDKPCACEKCKCSVYVSTSARMCKIGFEIALVIVFRVFDDQEITTENVRYIFR